MSRKGIVYELTLDGFVVQLVVPRDLRQWEADRIYALLNTTCVERRESDEP